MATAESSDSYFRVPLLTPQIVRMQHIFLFRNGNRQRIQLIKHAR